jgi:hypothetical protein
MHPGHAAPPLAEGGPVPWATISVVGLLGPACAAPLRRAGHRVSLDASVEFRRLEGSDLLVLALAPPEPTATELLPHIRRRSDLPVLAFEPWRPDVAPGPPCPPAGPGALVVCRTDEDLLAGVAGLLPTVAGCPVIDLRDEGLLVGAE